MEIKLISNWEKFRKEFKKLENPTFYINLESGSKGNVLRIYAESEEKILIFEPKDFDLRKWKNKLDKEGLSYKFGKSPVEIIE